MEKYLSQEGYDKLKKELEYLKGDKRREIAQSLNTAISFGDLSENAAYHEAKEAQAFLEGRILEVEEMLRNVRIVDSSLKSDKVVVGVTVAVFANGKESKFKIVGKNEADPFSGKISSESPLGKILLNKRVGETAILESSHGKMEYKILSIN